MKKAENFSIPNTNKELRELYNETKKGKVVLLFFPFAFSSVCSDEMCTIRDNMKMYNSLKATVFGISVDSFYTLREFKKNYNLNFELLSDFNKEASKSFDVLYEDFNGLKGVSKRAAFVIDEENNIKYEEVLEDAGNQPSYKNIVKSLSS